MCGTAPWFHPYEFYYSVYITVFLFLLPLLVMVVLYGRMIMTLKEGIQMDLQSQTGWQLRNGFMSASATAGICTNNLVSTSKAI